MRLVLVVVVVVGACSPSSDAPKIEPPANPPPKQPPVAPPPAPARRPPPPPEVPGPDGTTKDPCVTGDYDCTPPHNPGLDHPNGTRECAVECGDEAAAFSQWQRANRLSAPPGKAEINRDNCVRTCTLVRASCAGEIARGDDAVADCVTKLAVTRKDQGLCSALRTAPLMQRCQAAVPR